MAPWKYYTLAITTLVIGFSIGQLNQDSSEPLVFEKVKIIEVPVEKVVEKRVPFEVVKYVDRVVEKVVEKVVEVPVVKRVEVPVERIVYRDNVEPARTEAPKASRGPWGRLKKSQTMDEVEALLGQPVRRTEFGPVVVWSYGKSHTYQSPGTVVFNDGLVHTWVNP
jgi:hypothetical protein